MGDTRSKASASVQTHVLQDVKDYGFVLINGKWCKGRECIPDSLAVDKL